MKKTTLLLGSLLTLSTLAFGATLSEKIQNNSLVVYNSNVGLVHEERDFTLNANESFITYEGVASSIDTDSVNVVLPEDVTLYSQQYRFDKLTQNKLLEAHLGKKIEVRLLKNRNEYKVISATLLAHNGSNSIVKTTDYKIITVSSSAIIFSEIPKELITKPSLVWNVSTQKNIDAKMELDYLIKNISFKSDYILNINGNKADLSGWISINNRSGKSFKDTKLSLLAGDINRAEKRPVMYKNMRAMTAMDSSAQVTHQAYEGYHFYTIPFNVTLANNEKTQIKFVTKRDISIAKEYSSMLSNPLYLRGESKASVSQYIIIKALDIPLPKGVIRSYSKLKEQTILLGESSLQHTPKDTDIKLRLGKNFDTTLTQKILSRDDSKRWYEAEVLYTLKNSSKEAKQVEILVPFNRDVDSKIKTTQKYSFTKGNLVTFSIKIEAEQTKSFKVKYESKK